MVQSKLKEEETNTMTIFSLLTRKISQANNRRKFSIFNFFSSQFCMLLVSQIWVYQNNKSYNSKQFLKNYQILLYYITFYFHHKQPIWIEIEVYLNNF